MKKSSQFITSFIFLLTIGCSNGLKVESTLKNNETSLNELVKSMLVLPDHEFCVENNDPNKQLSILLTKNKLSCIRKQVYETIRGFNSEDSLIIMEKKLFMKSEYLIYDFSTSDRILKNIDIPTAAFKRKRIIGKWYLATQGFD